MKLSYYIKSFIMNYLVIFAIITIATVVLDQISYPNSSFERKEIFIIMFFALLGNLPSLIFRTTRTLSEQEMKIRLIIHFVLLEIILITFGVIMGYVTNVLQGIVFFAEISVIYLIVRYVAWQDDKEEADKINKKLRKMKYNRD